MVVGTETSSSITTFPPWTHDKKENVFINFIVNQLCEMTLIQRLLKVDISKIHRLSVHFIILMDLFPDFSPLCIHFT